MNREEILKLAEALGSRTYNNGGRSIVICCPLAKWTHATGTDKSPSCSVFIEDDDMSSFNCFTCHKHGTVSDLVSQINRLSGGGLEQLQIWVESVNKSNLSAKLDRAVKVSNPITAGFVDRYRIFDENELDDFKNRVPKYALDRGITIDSCKLWGLGYDRNAEDPRLIFPVRDRKAKLVGIVGRTIIKDKEPRYKNYWGFNKAGFLYGEHLINSQSIKPIIVVEGMIDPIIVKQYIDCDCLAQMGTVLSDEQAKKLISYAGIRPVITMYDGDKAGDSARKIAYNKLKSKIIVYHANLPRNSDPGSSNKEEIEKALNSAGV